MANEDVDKEQERAFFEWCALRERALETGVFTDAIASGKAFGRFHYLFVENSYRPSEKVVPFTRQLADIGGAG